VKQILTILLIGATVLGADVRLVCNANPPGEQVTHYGFWERTDGTNWTLLGTAADPQQGVQFQRPFGKYTWSATAFNAAGMSDYATPLEFELRDDSVTLKRPSAPVLAAVIGGGPLILFPPGAGGEVRYNNNPSNYFLSTMSQGDGGWYAGRFTTKGNPSTFSTTSFVYTNSGGNRWYGTGMGSFNTPYVGPGIMAPGYGSTTYNSVRRLVVPTIANSLTTIEGNIIAGSVSGRTLIFRVWHNSSLIYAYTNPASTAVNFNYGVTNITVVTADTLSWEVDKTLGGSVSGDVTFSGVLQ